MKARAYARWAGKSFLSARYDWSWKERVRRVEYANLRNGPPRKRGLKMVMAADGRAGLE